MRDPVVDPEGNSYEREVNLCRTYAASLQNAVLTPIKLTEISGHYQLGSKAQTVTRNTVSSTLFCCGWSMCPIQHDSELCNGRCCDSQFSLDRSTTDTKSRSVLRDSLVWVWFDILLHHSHLFRQTAHSKRFCLKVEHTNIYQMRSRIHTYRYFFLTPLTPYFSSEGYDSKMAIGEKFLLP